MPAPHQALIRVERCGVCGSDLSMTSGGAFDVPCGTVLGHEYAGEVVAVGADGWLQIGDRITALPMSSCGHCAACLADTPLHCAQIRQMTGGYGEYTLVEQRFAMRLPPSLSFADGALVEPLAAALRGVRKLPITAAARVAVIGAGAMGSASIFWARQLGAHAIAAITRSRRHEDLVQTMGADALLTTGEGLSERIIDALGGPPDIVIEAAGAAGTLQQALELVRPGGSILSLGGCMQAETILPVLAMWKEVSFIFSAAYGTREFRIALDTLDAGAVSPRAMIGEIIGLDELPARFAAMRSGAHAAKIMVNPTLA
jgi:(R,R)-butanediol dehydrogenase/meso-butanediol dehydrogenase/diacetyl reductase